MLSGSIKRSTRGSVSGSARAFQDLVRCGHEPAQGIRAAHDPVALKSCIEALQFSLTDPQADDLGTASIGKLAFPGMVGRVVNRLQADPVPGSKISSRDALCPLFGDAQAHGLGQSAAA